MIHFREILNISHDKKINPETIEKDYCLTWLLIGLSQTKLSRDLVFYGGTAIHKAYYPDHRFSEDLDFTVHGHLDINTVFHEFQKCIDLIKNKCNILFSIQQNSLSIQNDRYLFLIDFDGFPENMHEKSIRIDILSKNIFPSKPVFNPLYLTYSDMGQVPVKLTCYSLESILSEKIGTIFDGIRKEPRDLYDLWFLLKHKRFNLKKINSCYDKKYGIPAKTALDSLINKIKNSVYLHQWENRLKHQVPDLPAYETVLKETTHLIDQI